MAREYRALGPHLAVPEGCREGGLGSTPAKERERGIRPQKSVELWVEFSCMPQNPILAKL